MTGNPVAGDGDGGWLGGGLGLSSCGCGFFAEETQFVHLNKSGVEPYSKHCFSAICHSVYTLAYGSERKPGCLRRWLANSISALIYNMLGTNCDADLIHSWMA